MTTTPTREAAEREVERKSKQFWAVSDSYEVKLVTGYACPPNEDIWWVPELGYSMNEKHHLFSTEAQARAKAVKDLEKDIALRTKALTRLRKEAP